MAAKGGGGGLCLVAHGVEIGVEGLHIHFEQAVCVLHELLKAVPKGVYMLRKVIVEHVPVALFVEGAHALDDAPKAVATLVFAHVSGDVAVFSLTRL